MLIYLNVFFVLVIIMVMSAAAGLLIYAASDRLLPSSVIKHVLGVGATVLISYFITKLLRFEVWYFYATTIGMGILLYIVFVISFSKYSK